MINIAQIILSTTRIRNRQKWTEEKKTKRKQMREQEEEQPIKPEWEEGREFIVETLNNII
jgi:hypothetical protein